VSYPEMVALAGGEPVPVVCTAEQGFKLQPDALERGSRRRPSGSSVLASNPTCAAYAPTEGEHVHRSRDAVHEPTIMYETLVYDVDCRLQRRASRRQVGSMASTG